METEISKFTEKRRHPRVDVSIPLRYKELRGSTYLAKGTLSKNLSEGGVRFKTDKFLPLACHLLIEMSLPSIEKTIKTISKVTWVKKLPSGDNYEVGNHFLAMTDEDETLISRYVKKELNPLS